MNWNGNGKRVYVAYVHDGDSFETAGGETVSLARVQAPDMGTPGSEDAAHQLRELIEGKPVTIRPCGRSYKRYVAEVILDGLSVNDIMRVQFPNTTT